jgi:hypothetical protein
MAYKVTIDFKRGPSLSLDLYAANEQTAEAIAKAEAPLYGFTDTIKNVTVRPA